MDMCIEVNMVHNKLDLIFGSKIKKKISRAKFKIYFGFD